ncbi:MAG: hypothetical protein ACRCV3_03285 [Desulfovibrionaceae bacterium]
MRILLVFLANIGIILLITFIWFVSIEKDDHKNSYHAGVEKNLEYLKKAYGQKRIILMGGSSLGFGFSAEMLSEELGIPVRNIGRSAAYGMKNIWELHKDFLNPQKDIIVLSPEYELMQKSYSGFVSQEMCHLIYIRGSFKLLQEHISCAPFIVGQVGRDIGIWVKTLLSSNVKKKSGIYTEIGMNNYGDTISHYGRKSTYSNEKQEKVDIQKLKVVHSFYKEFIKTHILKKGFSVIYVPVTIERSFVEGIEEEIKEIQLNLLSYFGGKAEEIEEILWYDKKYFFDSPYHLVYSGRVKKHVYVRKILEDRLCELYRK